MAQLLSQDAQVAVTTANLLERLDLERLDISNRLAVDPDVIRRRKSVPISESSCGAAGSDLFLVFLFFLSTCRIYQVSDERIHGSAIQAELLEDTLSQMICVKHRP